jgi:phosphoribosylanthranilate isomerase
VAADPYTPRVKICGVTRLSDARLCASLRVDFLGFNLWEGSSRRVGLADALRIADALRSGNDPCPRLVLVCVTPALPWLAETCGALRPDYVQVHGEWGLETVFQGIPVIRAFSLGTSDDLAAIRDWPAEPVLVDARVEGMYGGTGKTIPPELVEEVARPRQTRTSLSPAGPLPILARPCFLAGGLTPSNVRAAVERFRPWGVDVASGVENAPGVKDPGLIRSFVQAARSLG